MIIGVIAAFPRSGAEHALPHLSRYRLPAIRLGAEVEPIPQRNQIAAIAAGFGVAAFGAEWDGFKGARFENALGIGEIPDTGDGYFNRSSTCTHRSDMSINARVRAGLKNLVLHFYTLHTTLIMQNCTLL